MNAFFRIYVILISSKRNRSRTADGLAFQTFSAGVELADLIVQKDLSVRQVEKLCKAKPKIQNEQKPEKKPSFYSMVELALAESLGRKISISKNKGKKGGVLQIEFYSDEELTELSNKLK